MMVYRGTCVVRGRRRCLLQFALLLLLDILLCPCFVCFILCASLHVHVCVCVRLSVSVSVLCLAARCLAEKLIHTART